MGRGLKGVRGWRSPHPLPSASQQGGEEEVKTWQVEPGGVGGVLGSVGKFLVFLFSFLPKILFS